MIRMSKILQFEGACLNLHNDIDLDRLEYYHGGVYYMSFSINDIYEALECEGYTSNIIYTMNNGWYFTLNKDIVKINRRDD